MTTATAEYSAQEQALAAGRQVLHGTVTDRVLRMFQDIRAYGPPRVALERAIYFTESFKTTEGQPLVLRWAKAMKNIAEKISVATFDGVDNVRIRTNLKRAYETFPDKTFIPRTPIIPGVNDDEDHVKATLAFIRPHKNVVDYELLPYMRFGESKYGFLGRVYEMQDFDPPTPEAMARIRAIIDEAFGRVEKA